MSGSLNGQDQAFVTSTSQDDLSEIGGGRQAEQQAGNLATAIYGRELVADHGFVAQQLNDAALISGATVATAPNAMQAAQSAQLQPLTGTAFDKLYLSDEVQGNAQSISDEAKEAASGQNASVQQLDTLLAPFQAQHLLQAQILQSTINGTAAPAFTQSAATVGPLMAPNGALNAQDQSYIKFAAADNAASIQSGLLAEAQSGDTAVAVFGSWLVLDHGELEATLTQAAQAAGVTPPFAPSPMDAAKFAQLKTLTGAAFATAYLQNERQAHIQGIANYEQEINNGADPALVAQAQAGLLLQEQHLAGAVEELTVLTAGVGDQAGGPSSAAGLNAAVLGNAVAQQAVTTGQELASVASAIGGSGLFVAPSSVGTNSLGSLTTPGGTGTANFVVTDTVTGATAAVAGSPTSGAVSYLQSQYIYGGTDSVTVEAATANVFIKGGAASDALVANSGSNVLDGGGGSNFLVGASGADGGTDTFFIDSSGGQNTWSTIVNFHVGDTLTLFGFNTAAGTTRFADNQGATGNKGTTLYANYGDGTNASTLVTFAGLTSSQATLVTTTGTTGGQSYLAVIRTA